MTCFDFRNVFVQLLFRDALKTNYLTGKYFLEVELEDLSAFDETLEEKLKKQPTENLHIFEEAAREVADEITAPRPEDEEEVHDIQILLKSKAHPTNIRDIKVRTMRISNKIHICIHNMAFSSRRTCHAW